MIRDEIEIEISDEIDHENSELLITYEKMCTTKVFRIEILRRIVEGV